VAYDENLADRMRRVLRDKQVKIVEKEMMGGLTFMVRDKMCVGIMKKSLMARIDPEEYAFALTKPGCREMDFTKRPMKGFVFVDPEGIDLDEELEYWIDLALDFNPRARSSKKKK